MEKIGPQNPEGDGHPIPIEKIELIDILAEKKDGKGVKLSIIVAGYLAPST